VTRVSGHCSNGVSLKKFQITCEVLESSFIRLLVNHSMFVNQTVLGPIKNNPNTIPIDPE
jgi:hypothetical protein